VLSRAQIGLVVFLVSENLPPTGPARLDHRPDETLLPAFLLGSLQEMERLFTGSHGIFPVAQTLMTPAGAADVLVVGTF